jgi:hypothetical protein
MSDSTSNSSSSTKNINNQERIHYTCDVCGVKVVSTNITTQCLGCGKNLCEICNTYNLCAQDFHLLKKKDQKKMKRFGRDIENARKSKTIFTLMPAILGIVGAILLLLMIILRKEILNFLFGFLGGFLLLSAFMMFFMFRNFEEREKKRIRLKIRELIIPYNIKRFKKIPVVETNEITNINPKKEFCSSCGSEIREVELKYCENCGISLYEK